MLTLKERVPYKLLQGIIKVCSQLICSHPVFQCIPLLLLYRTEKINFLAYLYEICKRMKMTNAFIVESKITIIGCNRILI